jgi:YHS domain-containing protein
MNRPTSLTVLVATTLLATAASAADPIYTARFSSTALGGYDAVAYFEEGRPVEGSEDLATEWRGATWRFSSPENLAAFQANPSDYAPQYGGYCAYAVAKGGTAPGDPLVWRIVDGKLYLNLNEEIGLRWAQDIPGYIAKAGANWPGVLD